MQYQNNNKPLEVTESGLCLLSDWCEHNKVDYQQTLRLLRKNNVPIKRFGSRIFYERKFLDVFLLKVLEAKRNEIDTKARLARRASYEKKQNNIIMEAFKRSGWNPEQIINWLRLNSSTGGILTPTQLRESGISPEQIRQFPSQFPNYNEIVEELRIAERNAVNKEIASISGYANELGMSNQNINTVLEFLFNRGRTLTTTEPNRLIAAREPRPGSYEAILATAARMATVPVRRENDSSTTSPENTDATFTAATPPTTPPTTPPASQPGA